MNRTKSTVGAELDALSKRLGMLTWLHVIAIAVSVLVYVPSVKSFHHLPRAGAWEGYEYLAAGLFVCWPYLVSWASSRTKFSEKPRGVVRYAIGFSLVSAVGVLFLALAPDALRTMPIIVLVTCAQVVLFKALTSYLSRSSTDYTAV